VFHLASLFANQLSVEQPERDLLVNGLGTLRLLLAAAKARVRRFTYVSSSCVYESGTGFDETNPRRSTSTPYAITKALGEDYAHYAFRRLRLPGAVVRLFNVYGPYELPGRYRNVIPNFIDLAMQRKPLPVTGTGQETRDFTFVDDVVRGLLLASRVTFDTVHHFNLGTGTETRIVDLANLINRITRNPRGVELQPPRDWDTVSGRLAETRLARELLGFEARTPLAVGLARTHEWLAQARTR